MGMQSVCCALRGLRAMAFASGVCLMTLAPLSAMAGDAQQPSAATPAPTSSRPLSQALDDSSWSQPPEKAGSVQDLNKPGMSRKDPYVPSYYNTRPDFSHQMQSDKLSTGR